MVKVKFNIGKMKKITKNQGNPVVLNDERSFKTSWVERKFKPKQLSFPFVGNKPKFSKSIIKHG